MGYTKLDYKDFKENLLYNMGLLDGEQWVFRFDNNYGASVVKHFGSYGSDKDLFELAVIKIKDKDDWNIVYDTPITNDVLGHLSNDDVLVTLNKIKNLYEAKIEDKPYDNEKWSKAKEENELQQRLNLVTEIIELIIIINQKGKYEIMPTLYPKFISVYISGIETFEANFGFECLKHKDMMSELQEVKSELEGYCD